MKLTTVKIIEKEIMIQDFNGGNKKWNKTKYNL